MSVPIGGLSFNAIAASARARSGGGRSLYHPDTEAWRAEIQGNGGEVDGDVLGAADEHVFIPLEPLKPKIRQLLLISGTNTEAIRVAAYGPNASLINFVAGDYSQATGLQGGPGKALLSNVINPRADDFGAFFYGTGLTGPSGYWFLTGSIDAAQSYTMRLNNNFGTLEARFGLGGALAINSAPIVNGFASIQAIAGKLRLYENSLNTSTVDSSANFEMTQTPAYLGRNNAGTIDAPAPSTLFLYSCGISYGMTASEVEQVRSALVNFGTAIGRVA